MNAQAQRDDDPVSKLIAARKNLLTLANVNFPAAVASGLGYVDEVTGVVPGQSVEYGLIPTATLRSYLTGKVRFELEALSKPQISVVFGEALTVGTPVNLQGYALDRKSYLRWDDSVDAYTRNILSGYVVERKLVGETSFKVLNPDEPVVKMYAKDDKGNLLEPDVLYTDETIANGSTAAYQVRSVDVFGRTSAPSPAVDLTVFKTVPPATPAVGLAAIAKDPDLSKPVLASVTPMSAGADDVALLMQRGKITTAQLQQLEANVEYAELKAAGSIDEEHLRQFVVSRLLSQAQFDELLQITGKTQEIARRSQLESRIASIRQSSSQKSGAVLIFNHSVEGDETNVKLAEDLREYRVYRSEALGKGSFSEPAVVSTIPLNRLASPYGNSQDPKSDLIYFDTDVSPGHYYAYWITARDGSENESPVQSKPQIVGYPSEVIPGSPQNPENQFEVNEELVAPQPKVAGFSERLKIKMPQALLGPVAAQSGPLSNVGLGKAKGRTFLTTRDLHRLVIVGSDEVNADGSVTIGWLPSTDPELVGYLIYRAHDPSGAAQNSPLTEDNLEQMRWSLVKVNADPDPNQSDLEEEQVLASNQLRDKVALPTSGCYLYQVYVIRTDTFGPPSTAAEDEDPYVEGGRVTVKWAASTDPQVAGYRVYRSDIPREAVTGTLAGFVPRWDMIAQLVTNNEYVDVVDQSKVHFYQYKVSAVSIWGVESPTTVIANSVRISTTIPPAVPSFLTPISQPGQVQLRWKPVYDATKYTIYRASKPLPEVTSSDLVTVMREERLIAATQVSDEEALLKLVEEKMGELTEEQQLALYKKVKERFGVLALAPYYALDEQSAAEVKWEPVHTETVGYAQNERNALNNNVMTWTDTQVQYPNTSMYSIEAENEDLLPSGLSAPVTIGPQKSVGPAAPDPITLLVDGDQVKLTWKPYTLKTPVGYLVFKALDENGQYQQCSPLLETSEFTESIELGQEWWYRVVIIDEVGLMSAAAKPVKASRPALNLRSPGLDLNPGRLPGNKPGGIVPALPGRDLPKLPSLQGTALQTAPSFPTLPGKIRPLPSKPAAPVITAGETTATTVSLSWPAADNVTQYKVYGYKTEQPEKLLVTADGDATSCVVAGLAPSTKYFFYVIAVNDLGDSPLSKVVSATTKAASVTPPQWGKLNIQVTATSLDSITLSWSDTGAAPEGYKIYYYKTEQPEQLLQTVSGSTTSFTAKGLSANTKYFFYVRAFKDGKESSPSNVASDVTKVQAQVTPVPAPTTLPGTLTVAGYTVSNIKEAPLLGTNGSIGKQTVGELAIAGLAPITVRLDVQEFRADTLTKGSVSLSGYYQQALGNARLFIDALNLNATAGPAKIAGRLTVPGVSPISLSNSALTADGTITLDSVTDLWVGEYQLSNLSGAKVKVFGVQRGILADAGWLETSLGQITMQNKGLQLSGAQLSVDFGGKLTGLFNRVEGDGRPIDLVVPRLMGLTITSATIKLDQGVVDTQISQIAGKIELPFIEGELTATVVTPTDNSGANQPPTPGRDQEQVSNPGDFFAINEKLSFGSLSAAGTVMNLGNQGKQALKGSMSYLVKNAAKATAAATTAPSSAQTQNQSQNQSMRMSMANTFTMRYFSSVPFEVASWDGKSLQPTADQVDGLEKILVKELHDRRAIVQGSGMDESYILQLEASDLKFSLPTYQLQNSAESASSGGPGYRGFEILDGFMTLPPSGVALRNPDAAQGKTYRIPIPTSTIFYSRNGLIGRLDTEAASGTSVDIWLNGEVAATMTGAAIDLDANKVQWAMAGTIPVPQLTGKGDPTRIVNYGAFSDPQGGLIFRIEPEKVAVTSSSGRSVQITGGTLKGTDLYLDGRLNVNTPNITLANMDFVSLRLYMGQDHDEQQAQATDYGQGLAATPVEAKIKDFTMETTGVQVVQNRDGFWEFAVTGATALVNNLPLNKGTVINLDTNLDEKAGTFKAKLNYTYEQFLTIDVNVQYEKDKSGQGGEFRGEGEFWFITGEEGDEQRSQATGTVQARVGVKDGVSYWVFKLGYGQSTKTWTCDKCGFELQGNHPPVKCPGTKNGSPCTGTKDDYKTDWQCSLCKTVVHAKEAPKSCDGKKDGKDCQGDKDNYKQVSTPKTQEDAAGAGLMLGPVQINTIMAMMGYNVELPKAKDGTFDVPVGFDNDQKLYEWKTLSNGDMFFVAKATMTIWHDGERFLTLDPVRLVIASGPAVEMEASIKRDNKLLAYGKIGYYHEDRRFFLAVKVPKLELPGIKARLEDLNLLLDFSPKKQIVNLSYPEMVKLYIPGSPWDFAGGFAYENNDGNYVIKMKARAQYGFDEEFSILYIKAKVGLTVDANLGFPKNEQGETEFEFQLMILLEGDLRGGIKIDDYVHEILHAYVGLTGYLGKTRSDEWWVYGKAKIYYHIDLWLWEDEGEEEWTVGEVPQGVELLKATESKDEKPKDNKNQAAN